MQSGFSLTLPSLGLPFIHHTLRLLRPPSNDFHVIHERVPEGARQMYQHRMHGPWEDDLLALQVRGLLQQSMPEGELDVPQSHLYRCDPVRVPHRRDGGAARGGVQGVLDCPNSRVLFAASSSAQTQHDRQVRVEACGPPQPMRVRVLSQ